MPVKVSEVKPPKGLSRLLWRTPIWVYRLGLGGLMGGRLLLLNHTGRVSGQPRQNVLEVVDHDESENTYTIAAGFGKESDWYKNIMRTPEVTIQVGNREMAMTAVPLGPEASGQVMVKYAHRNPRAAKELMRFCGYKVDGSDEDYYIMGHDIIPFVVLRPRD